MNLLAIMMRVLPLVTLLLGIAAMASRRPLQTRTIVLTGLAAVAVLAVATAIVEASWMETPSAYIGRFLGAGALLYGLPGATVITGVILLQRDHHRIWLRIGVLAALYFVAAHVGLRLSAHVVDFVNAVG